MYDIINMKSIAKTLNDMTYTDYYYRLMLIARSVFEWKNLPNGLNEKWIERYLFNDGSCVFFNDNIRGFMIARANMYGKVNFYEEATMLQPYTTDSVTLKPLENNVECIQIQNNDLLTPSTYTIQLFAYRLAEIQRTIDVNISAQKTPVVVLCSNKQKLSFKRAFENISDNEVAIYGDKDLDLSEIKALKIDAPIVFDKLQTQKQNVWNEALTFLGINNNTQEAKRERLVVNEVDANNEMIEASANVMLKSRKEACKRINELFDLNISVRMRNFEEIKQLNKIKDGEEE